MARDALDRGAYGRDCLNVVSGCIYLNTRRPFVRKHELGHAYDEQVLTAADRSEFLAMTGYPRDADWGSGRPLHYSNVEDTPVERFADAYAMCALGHTRIVGWWYPHHPRRICKFIANLEV